MSTLTTQACPRCDFSSPNIFAFVDYHDERICLDCHKTARAKASVNTTPTPDELVAAEDSGYLCFVDGTLTMRADGGIRVPVQSAEHLEHLMDLLGGGCMCSSGIDYPEDETTDANALAICRGLRK